MTDLQLKRKIFKSLRQQGFEISRKGDLRAPQLQKDDLRSLHSTAVDHRIQRARPGLERHEGRLIRRIADGREVNPAKLSPRLIEVQPDSEDELLFRYASLHWSIPVSSGYGRRLRFLVIDDYNEKLIGILGLGDPVFGLGDRDKWIGWDKEARRQRLQNVMDAFVLGAIPPYSFLLGGKLVAMLTVSDEVRRAFQRKYAKTNSVISDRKLSGQLVLVTTISALGRSSIYNRIRFDGRPLLYSAGFTAGSGEFHFSNGLYGAISEFADSRCLPTAKQERWGTGFRNRREVIKKTLQEIGISPDWLYHGVRREIFVAPLASNAGAFLRGEAQRVRWLHQSASDLFTEYRERWLLPRSTRDPRYRDYVAEDYKIWLTRNERIPS